MKTIPLSVPNLNENIIYNLKECIHSGWVSTGGSFIQRFEEKLAAYLQVDEVVGVQSGTEALHLVYHYLDFKECEVICPTVTFVASVNPLLYEGSFPVFMDCDDTLNMDLDKLERFCFEECELIEDQLINKKTKRHVKGLVVVHVFGNPIDMERVMDLAERFHLLVVEDAAESLGSYYTEGRYKGQYTGTIGHAGVLSFNANKIITTGGGGAIISHDKKLLSQCRFWSQQAKTDPLYFKHDEMGYNYRMLNLNAALGVSQIDELETFIKTKQENYLYYKKQLKNLKGLKLLGFNQNARVNHWFYSLIVDDFKESRDELLMRLNHQKIQTRPLWGLMHEQKHLKQFQTYKIEKAPYYQAHVLNLPCSTNLTRDDIFQVTDLIENNPHPLVSIITPVYNSGRFIGETIESVLNQTYPHFEMLCVDDCSTDDSADIINQYAKMDNRIKYIRLPKNGGAAIARNTALEIAKGRFIAFLDSDDIWKKDKLKVQVDYMLLHHIGFSFTTYQMMDVDGNLYERMVKAPPKIDYNKLLRNTIIGCLTVMIDKRIYGDFRMPDVRNSQDYATWLALLKKGQLAYGIDENLAVYRRVNGSISNNKLKALRSNWKVYRECEHLSITKTMVVFVFYVLHALKKHLLLR